MTILNRPSIARILVPSITRLLFVTKEITIRLDATKIEMNIKIFL